MNLFLQVTTDPVWSLIFFLAILLSGVVYVIAYILIMAYKEMQDGKVREQGQEGHNEAESRQRDCEES